MSVTNGAQHPTVAPLRPVIVSDVVRPGVTTDTSAPCASVPDGDRVSAARLARARLATDAGALRILVWPAAAPDNPYISLLNGSLTALGADVVPFAPRQLLRRRAAIWHLHWVEDMWNRPGLLRAGLRVVALLLMLHVARRRGTRVVWTVHNLHTHERFHPRLERWFWARFIGELDGYLALTSAGMALAQERFPALRALPGFVVPHGHYRDAYPATIARDEARARLGIAPDERVIAFLGKVRPYKNVPHLVRTFRTLLDPRMRLLVAGSAGSAALEEEVRAAADTDPRVRLELRHIPADEVQLYLRAADLVALPYQDILNSGSALLALSFDRPVLVPDRGAMGELAQRVGPSWVRTYQGSLSAAELEAAIDWALAARQAVCEGLGKLDWTWIARETIRSFECVMQAGVSGAKPVSEGT